MVTLKDYDSSVFNTLPIDTYQFRKFIQNPVPETSMEAIRMVFNKHQVESQAALALIHRHFELEDSERLVEYGRVSAPWVVNESLAPSVHAKSWRFIDDEMYPYEFAFDPYNQPSEDAAPQPFSVAFLTDFNATLKEYDLVDTFGLALAGPVDEKEPCLVEFTAGRTNVLRPPTSAENQEVTVEALWSFACVWSPLVDGFGQPQTRLCRVRCPFCIC